MNRLSEFDEEKFTFIAFCDRCGHSAELRRTALDPQLRTSELIRRLRCRVCAGTDCSIRIVYTGAGGFHYRSD